MPWKSSTDGGKAVPFPCENTDYLKEKPSFWNECYPTVGKLHVSEVSRVLQGSGLVWL